MRIIKSGENAIISSKKVSVLVTIDAPKIAKNDIDVSAYLLGENKKVRSDADFVFYGQPKSEEGSVVLTEQIGGYSFDVDVSLIPANVNRIAIAIAIHSSNTFGDAKMIKVDVGTELSFTAETMGMAEKALILGELYQHNDNWKFKAFGAGFNGGLAPLATSYGVNVEGDPTDALNDIPVAAPAKPMPVKINLQKTLEQKAPRLINLAKPALISLEKKNLSNVKAQVAFVLDCSGSMTKQFKVGNVQAVLDRIAVLAVQFDDNASIDLWAFADRHAKYDDVTLENLDGYIERLTAKKKGLLGGMDFNIVSGLGGCNNEPPVMEEVVAHYADSKIPAFVIFITDGGVNQSRKIEKIIKDASSLPIFWKFVGLGGRGYGVLEKLDDMRGRTVDNADFFPIDDFKKIDDTVLYERLLNEFDGWLSAAKTANIL